MSKKSKVGWTLFFAVAFAPAQLIRTVAMNPGPGVDFTSLPAAVAASGPGDVLLVGPGTFQPFSVTGKDLHIFGAGPGQSFISGPAIGTAAVYIANVPAGKKFDLAGFTINASVTPSVGPFIQLGVDTASVSIIYSSVVLSDVAVPSPSVPSSAGGHQAGLFCFSSVVAATRCSFSGGWNPTGSFSLSRGFAGAFVNGAGSNFVANDCDFLGGTTTFTPGRGIIAGTNLGIGGPGVEIWWGNVVLSDCSCAGGNVYTSASTCSVCLGTGTGGAGVGMNYVLGTARLNACSVVGGSAYANGANTPGNGISISNGASCATHGAMTIVGGFVSGSSVPGPAVSGPVQTGLPAFASLALSGTNVNGGELSATVPVTLTIDAPLPFAPFVVLLDLYPGLSFPYPTLLMNELVLGASWGLVFSDFLDSAGHYALTFTPSLVAPGATNAPLHLQAFVADFGNAYWRGSNQEIRVFRN